MYEYHVMYCLIRMSCAYSFCLMFLGQGFFGRTLGEQCVEKVILTKDSHYYIFNCGDKDN